VDAHQHTYFHEYPDLDTNMDPHLLHQPDPHQHGDLYLDGYPHRYGHPYPDLDAHLDRDRDAQRLADLFDQPDTDFYRFADGHGHRDFDLDADGYPDFYIHSDVDGNLDPHLFDKSHPYVHGQPDLYR